MRKGKSKHNEICQAVLRRISVARFMSMLMDLDLKVNHVSMLVVNDSINDNEDGIQIWRRRTVLIYCTILLNDHITVCIFFSSTSYCGFFYSSHNYIDNATNDNDTIFSFV